LKVVPGPTWRALQALRGRWELRRRRRQLEALERVPMPFLARLSAGIRRPTISVGHAKGSAALIVEENRLFRRGRTSRVYPLHPNAANDVGRALIKAAGKARK